MKYLLLLVGVGLLPCSPHWGKPCFTHTKFSPPPASSDLPHPPKHHSLGDPYTSKSICKTLSWGVKGAKMGVSMEKSLCKSKFQPFQMPKRMLPTFRDWIINYENGLICLVFLFSSWILFLLYWKWSYFMNLYCQ